MASVAVKVASSATSAFTAGAQLANGAGSTAFSGAVGDRHRRGYPGESGAAAPEARKLLAADAGDGAPVDAADCGDGEGPCGGLAAEVAWGYAETHAMLLGDEPLADFSWPVRYNPCYWALVVTIMACLLPGRWAHAPLGQGGPVRDDELPAEKVARIQWIYCTDGPMVLTVLLAAVELAYYAAAGDLGWNQDTWAALLSALIAAAYVGGNCLFLDAMRRRDVVRVRVGIVANATFGLGMLVLLAFWITIRGWDPGSWDAKKWGTIALRTVVIVFYCAVIFDYAPLWHAYDDRDVDAGVWRATWIDAASILGSAAAALVVLALLAAAIATSGDVVWQTLVG